MAHPAAENRVLNWTPDPPDPRDDILTAEEATKGGLPPSTDLRGSFPHPPYDQSRLGSCTANAWAGAVAYERAKLGDPNPFIPSRLFIYYEERVILDTVADDSGAYLRNGAAVVHKRGAPPEDDWTYDIDQFTVKPPETAYADAFGHRATSYARVPRAFLRATLAAGLVIPFGFVVYESFESQAVGDTGEVPMPAKGERIIGGHATVLCGYDDARQRFVVRNSWGTGWGQGGYFTMPYRYLANERLASDFWTIRAIA